MLKCIKNPKTGMPQYISEDKIDFKLEDGILSYSYKVSKCKEREWTEILDTNSFLGTTEEIKQVQDILDKINECCEKEETLNSVTQRNNVVDDKTEIIWDSVTEDQRLSLKVDTQKQGLYFGVENFKELTEDTENGSANNIGIGYHNFKNTTLGESSIGIGTYVFRNQSSGSYNIGLGTNVFDNFIEQSEVGKVNKYTTGYPRLIGIGNGVGRYFNKATNSVVIGNIFGARPGFEGELNNKFVIHSPFNGYYGYHFYKETGVLRHPQNSLSLLYGDFKDQWLELGGKLRLRPQLNRPQTALEDGTFADNLMLVYTDDNSKKGEVNSVNAADYILSQIKNFSEEQKQELKEALGL